jgi:hypothetical protein
LPPYSRVVKAGLELELTQAVRCSKLEVAILAAASSAAFLVYRHLVSNEIRGIANTITPLTHSQSSITLVFHKFTIQRQQCSHQMELVRAELCRNASLNSNILNEPSQHPNLQIPGRYEDRWAHFDGEISRPCRVPR